MTTVDFMNSLPAEVAEGDAATAEGASHAFRNIEGLFQEGVHGQGENFAAGGALHGQSFRKNGLTEVFKRSSSGDFWVGGGNRRESRERQYDIPGGALRFRLRAPADVIVFFTGSIHRFNRPDYVYRGTEGSGAYATDWAPHGYRSSPKAGFYLKFQSWWEAEDKEPGREYEQARSFMKGWGALIDEMGHTATASDPIAGAHWADMSRSIFLPWKIRPHDTSDPGDFNRPIALADTRNVSVANPLTGGTSANTHRLQAGWHNIRHTATELSTSSGGYVPKGEDNYVADHSRITLRGLVFADTELVVIANYGPRKDLLAGTFSNAIVNQAKQDKKAEDKGFGIVAKARVDL